MSLTNWAGNLTFGATRTAVPGNVAEVQEAVRAAKKIRVYGSRHCFNDIADTPDTHISLEKLNRVVSIDTAGKQVTIEGGIRYSDLGPVLHDKGLDLHNLASLPHITVAGACATATHGSGTTVGNLATAVAGIEFINADGDLVSLSRDGDPDIFDGVPVNLGALGVITRLTLDAVPAFNVRQSVYQNLPMTALEANFGTVMASGYSVSLFTTWVGDAVEQVWVKSRDDTPSNAAATLGSLGATAATEKLHPATGPQDAANCTEQMGVVGPAYNRLPHFRHDSIPATSGDHQAEYFVPVEHTVPAIRALRKFAPKLAPVLGVSELRIIAADDLWMSPAYHRPVVGFHFSFGTNWPALLDVLPGLEEIFAPFNPVPHWGKLFAMPAEKVQASYARLGDFRALLDKHDPAGKFRNGFVDRYVFGKA